MINTDTGFRNVLIVEDEDALRSALADRLRAKGITTFTAQNSDEAIKILRSTNIALVVSDVSMPGKSGLDLLGQVRAEGMSMPFAFLTGHDAKDLMLTAIRLGAADFIQKPFNSSELLHMVFRNVEIGKLRHDLEQLVLSHLQNVPDSARVLADYQHLKKQIGLLQVANTKLR